jgi:hypothetical protein
MRQFKGDTNPVFNLGHDMTPDDDSTTHLNIISSVNIKQIFINNTKNGIQRFGKKTLTCAIFTRQYS